MARPFGSLNTDDPQWLQRMSVNPPACYTPASWIEYLRAVQLETQDDAKLRAKVNRGARPNYCAECLPSYRASMKAQRMCKPHPESKHAKAQRKAAARRDRHMHRAVVSLDERTWQVRAWAELGDVLQAGFSPTAVARAIASGKAYRGRLWRWATQVEPRQAAGATPAPGMQAMHLLVHAVTDSQLTLELSARQD